MVHFMLLAIALGALGHQLAAAPSGSSPIDTQARSRSDLSSKAAYQILRREAGYGDYGNRQYGSRQYGSQSGSGQSGSGQYGSRQYGSGQSRSSQSGSGQYGSRQYGSSQSGSAQAGSSQSESGKYGGGKYRGNKSNTEPLVSPIDVSMSSLRSFFGQDAISCPRPPLQFGLSLSPHSI